MHIHRRDAEVAEMALGKSQTKTIPKTEVSLDRVRRGLLLAAWRLLRFLHPPRELLQLDTVQIGYGPISHA